MVNQETIYFSILGWARRRFPPADFEDAAHSIYLRLLEKNRFDYYEKMQMTSAEIETQINRIEIGNFVNEELRRRRPESYRLATRISNLVKTDAAFYEANAHSIVRRSSSSSSSRVFGLAEWRSSSSPPPRRPLVVLAQRVDVIAPRHRCRLKNGRGGQTEIIISGTDLRNLIIEIYRFSDSLISIKDLRTICLARLPIFDASFTPIFNAAAEREADFPDTGRGTPENDFVERESEEAAAKYADVFLKELFFEVRGKEKQFARMLDILRLFYLSRRRRTQIEIAAMLGISDSLVSDYLKRIESKLKRLPFRTLREAEIFEESLGKKIKERS